MTKKLTISIDNRVYEGLHAVIGRGHIGKFLEDLARPFVVTDDLAAAYIEMSADETREAEAVEWCDALAADGLDAPR
jgi:hypothetical protein